MEAVKIQPEPHSKFLGQFLCQTHRSNIGISIKIGDLISFIDLLLIGPLIADLKRGLRVQFRQVFYGLTKIA